MLAWFPTGDWGIMNKRPAAHVALSRPRALTRRTIKKPASAATSLPRPRSKQSACHEAIASAAAVADAGAKATVCCFLRPSTTGPTAPGDGLEPLIPKDQWKWLPQWIALYAERGSHPRCWEGHRLTVAAQDRLCEGSCVFCEARPPAGDRILRCKRCPHWVVCARCEPRPRIPTIEVDPLFHGPRDPCLLHNPQTAKIVPAASRGAVIICPGGNYEFLCPQEGPPVAEWLAQNGIRAFVLRYRLLPMHNFTDMLADLASAIPVARRAALGGPVVAMGFSAGGHLVAAFNCQARSAREGQQGDCSLDAQVLVYPCIDSSDWAHPDDCGFFDYDKSFPAAQSLHARREAMLGGRGFRAPPSLVVASTADEASPPEEHTDRYVQALKAASIPHRYLKRDFGPHGFGLEGGWTKAAVRWLQLRGVGARAVSATGAAAILGG